MKAKTIVKILKYSKNIILLFSIGMLLQSVIKNDANIHGIAERIMALGIGIWSIKEITQYYLITAKKENN